MRVAPLRHPPRSNNYTTTPQDTEPDDIHVRRSTMMHQSTAQELASIADFTVPKSKQDNSPMSKNNRVRAPRMSIMFSTLQNLATRQDITMNDGGHISPHVLPPDSLQVFVWATIVAFMSLFNFIVLPFLTSFDATPWRWVYVLFFISDVVFILDVFANLMIAYEQDGLYVFDAVRIRRRYFQSFGAYVDIGCLIPLELLCIHYGIAWLPHFRLWRLIRTPRLFRHYAGFKMSLFQRINSHIVRLGQMVFIIFLSSHAIACFFFGLHMFQTRMLGASETWVTVHKLDPDDADSMYVLCLYWAVYCLTNVGLGDVSPTNDLERLFLIVVMLWSAVLNTLSLSAFATFVGSMQRSTVMFRMKMKQVNQYLQDQHVPSDLQERIRSYYQMIWNSGKEGGLHSTLCDLPPLLRSEIALFLRRTIVSKVPLFTACSDSGFISSVVSAMTEESFLPGDSIFSSGDIATEIYFIADGEVKVSESGGFSRVLKQGSYFGESALFGQGYNLRAADVVACTYTTCLKLKNEDMEKIFVHYPTYKSAMQLVATRRRKELFKKQINNTVQRLQSFSVGVRQYNTSAMAEAADVEKTEQPSHSRFNPLHKLRLLLDRLDLLDPSSLRRRFWNRLQFFLTLIPVFATPLLVVYAPPKAIETVVLAFVYVTDVFFLCDLFICFNTHSYVKGERVSFDGTYLSKLEKICAVASALPLDVFAVFGWRFLHPLRIFRSLRVTLLFGYLRNYTAKLEDVESTVLRVWKMFFWLIWNCHYVGCLFLLIGLSQSTTDTTWMGLAHLISSSEFSQYVASIYWVLTVLTTVGFNDIMVVTSRERIFAVFIMYLGMGLNSYLFGSMASLVSELDQASERYRKKIDSVNSYLRSHNLPQSFRTRVVTHVNICFAKMKGVDEQNIINECPMPLQTRVAVHIARDLVEACDFLRNPQDPAFQRAIVPLLKRQMYMANEYVVKCGDIGTEVYFIFNGEVAVENAHGTQIAVLRTGQYFGEQALLKTTTRATSVRTTRVSEVLYLSQDDFRYVLCYFPTFRSTLIARAAWTKVRQVALKAAQTRLWRRQSSGCAPSTTPGSPPHSKLPRIHNSVYTEFREQKQRERRSNYELSSGVRPSVINPASLDDSFGTPGGPALGGGSGGGSSASLSRKSMWDRDFYFCELSRVFKDGSGSSSSAGGGEPDDYSPNGSDVSTAATVIYRSNSGGGGGWGGGGDRSLSGGDRSFSGGDRSSQAATAWDLSSVLDGGAPPPSNFPALYDSSDDGADYLGGKGVGVSGAGADGEAWGVHRIDEVEEFDDDDDDDDDNEVTAVHNDTGSLERSPTTATTAAAASTPSAPSSSSSSSAVFSSRTNTTTTTTTTTSTTTTVAAAPSFARPIPPYTGRRPLARAVEDDDDDPGGYEEDDTSELPEMLAVVCVDSQDTLGTLLDER